MMACASIWSSQRTDRRKHDERRPRGVSHSQPRETTVHDARSDSSAGASRRYAFAGGPRKARLRAGLGRHHGSIKTAPVYSGNPAKRSPSANGLRTLSSMWRNRQRSFVTVRSGSILNRSAMTFLAPSIWPSFARLDASTRNVRVKRGFWAKVRLAQTTASSNSPAAKWARAAAEAMYHARGSRGL